MICAVQSLRRTRSNDKIRVTDERKGGGGGGRGVGGQTVGTERASKHAESWSFDNQLGSVT